MENIAADPIISYYFKLTTDAKDLGGFSEIRLRLALTQILCKRKYHYVFDKADLELYRKVLLLFYSSKYETAELHAIMTCFDEETIKLHLGNRQEIINQWHNFQNVKLISIAHREAATEILKEWHYRLLLSGAKLNEVLLEAQMARVLSFLKWDLKYRRKFELQIFRFLTDSSMNRQISKETPLDLDAENIYEWLKPNLSTWIVGMIENKVRGSKRPSVLPQNVLQQLNRLPVGTTFELEKSSSGQKATIKRPKKRIIVEVEEVATKKPKQLLAETVETLMPDDDRADNSINFPTTQDMNTIAFTFEGGEIKCEKVDDTEQQFPADENSTNSTISQDLASCTNGSEKCVDEQNANEAVLLANDQSSRNTKESFESTGKSAEATEYSAPQELDMNLYTAEEDVEMQCVKSEYCATKADDCHNSKYSNVIDFSIAMSYIQHLKIYALSHELFEALDPLEEVEEIFK